MIPKSALSIAAAGAGICFIGYCVYFDRKRRSDPNFKQRLREKRRQARNNLKNCKTLAGVTEIPDLSNPEIKQKFIAQEVNLGDELLNGGDVEGGLEHFSYAIVASDHPQPILQALQQVLPPQLIAILLEKLPIAAQRISTRLSPEGFPSPSPRPTNDAVLAEDDVE